MPPLPPNSMAYPPGSGYEPLASGDDDLESGSSGRTAFSVNRVLTRTYAVSPYQSHANSPTPILKAFLDLTRGKDPLGQGDHKKQLQLRVSISKRIGSNDGTSAPIHFSLPLPELSDRDSIPFALANDTPCLRGLSSQGPKSFGQRVSSLLQAVRICQDSSAGSALKLSAYDEPYKFASRDYLQIWNAQTNRADYATDEQTHKYDRRVRRGADPPWLPLSSNPTQPRAREAYVGEENDANKTTDGQQGEGGGEDDEEDMFNVFKEGKSDFDLGSLFVNNERKRQSSRLISVGLQEAIERFSDDRHFSKWLICTESVWGWDWKVVAKEMSDMVLEEESKLRSGKGKARDDDAAADVQVSVEGLSARPIFHVVWAPIPVLERLGFGKRIATLALLGWAACAIGLIVLGAISRRWTIALVLLVTILYSTCVYLVRTQNNCVFDGIGTAWTLRAAWVKVEGADAGHDEARVRRMLAEPEASAKLSQQEDGWYYRRGTTEAEWVANSRGRIRAALKRQV